MALNLPVRDPDLPWQADRSVLPCPRTCPLDDRPVVAEQIERCRAAARALAPGEWHFSLQLFDLGRLRARVGRRWDALRPRAVAMIEAGLAEDLGPADLIVDDGGERLFVIRAARERCQIERQGGLLASQITARLCGTIPGGAIIGVETLPFDPDRELAGASSTADLLVSLAALGRGHDRNSSPPRALPELQARYRPILNLRKRLVSAYRLIADARDGRTACAVEADLGQQIDGWALQHAADVLLGPRHSREPALVVPVHYPSLAAGHARQPFLHACRRLPPRARRQMVFELIGLPETLSPARLREILDQLRPFCLAALVRLPHRARDIGQLAGSGARGVCLPAVPESGPDALGAIVGAARIAGLRSMLVDIEGPTSLRAAASAGIDHVSGDGLMPPLWRPGRAFVVG